MIPIWKDYTINVSASVAWFEVYDNDIFGDLLYYGKVVAKPNAATVEIKLNSICADYLTSELSTFNNGLTLQPALSRTFAVRYKTSEAGAWSAPVSVEFYNDWSYEADFDADTTGCLSYPITGEMDRRQPLFYTYGKIGTAMINDGFVTSQSFSGAGTLKVSEELAANDKVIITADGLQTTYRLLPACYRYALYYVNAFGGWDSLLIKGTSVESEDYKRKSIDAAYDNKIRTARGKRDYLNEVTRKMVLHSGWLSEEESGRMGHLLGSNLVFLYDIVEGTFTPAVITNSSWTKQDYDSEANSPIDYEIQIEIARDYDRR